MNRAGSTGRRTICAARFARVALGLWFALPIGSVVTALVAADTGNMRLISSAKAAPAALTKAQADALDGYNNAVAQFKSVLTGRRAQIEANQPLPNLPGQALYLARVAMMMRGAVSICISNASRSAAISGSGRTFSTAANSASGRKSASGCQLSKLS